MSRLPFLRKLRKYVGALPALAFGFMANPAFSTIVTVNASGVTAGSSSASFLGATLSPGTGKTFSKTTSTSSTQDVIGVGAGYVPGEIDVFGASSSTEKMTLSFGATGAVINEITIGLLYLSGVTLDLQNEAAHMQTNGGTACASGSISFCILSASGVWRGAFTGVQVLSPGTAGNFGIFKITNPFPLTPGSSAGELINSIEFMPWVIGAEESAKNSDFGLMSVTYTTTLVPEPGTFLLVSLGLLGLAFARARRTRG